MLANNQAEMVLMLKLDDQEKAALSSDEELLSLVPSGAHFVTHHTNSSSTFDVVQSPVVGSFGEESCW